VIGMFADDLGLPDAAGTNSANGTSPKEDR
jgi:hypothetical protein